MIDELVEIVNNHNSNDYRDKSLLEISRKIYQLEINDIKTFECDKFIIHKHIITLSDKQRSYLVKIPKNYDTTLIKKCILFFHGSRDLNWDTALLSTNMINNKFITVYLQGNNQGKYELEEPHICEHGYISYGQNYFEIRDFTDNFYEDIEYVKLVKQDIILKYNMTDFYAVGHSNGGVFLCLFPIFLPNEFISLVSHQGGVGWDEWFNIPFDKLDHNSRKPSIYFYTGDEDIHKIPCIQAHQIFINEGFDTKIYIEENLKHTWEKKCEDNIFEYLLNYN
jgi:hypothetical protein